MEQIKLVIPLKFSIFGYKNHDMEVKLTQEQLSKLEAALLEIPGKYSIPILQMVNGFIQENNISKDKIEEAEVLGSV